MPDIREVLKSLDPQDKLLWTQHRTEMRRSYLNAHNTTMGIARWDDSDDAFLDLIDIKLALLFDKSGKMDSAKTIVEKSDASKIEDEIAEAFKPVKSNGKDATAEVTFTGASPATKLMQGGWTSKP